MQRRRKALGSRRGVDWVDQDTGSYRKDGDDEDDESDAMNMEVLNGDGIGIPGSMELLMRRPAFRKLLRRRRLPAVTAAPETVPPETAAPTASETTAAVPETTAASGMLTPETKDSGIHAGPWFRRSGQSAESLRQVRENVYPQAVIFRTGKPAAGSSK